MAEGGDPFAYKDPAIDDALDNDDDDDKTAQPGKDANTTGPFQPSAASTPYNGGDQFEMQTMMHKQSGLPDTSYEETPLLGAQDEAQRSWDALTIFFPEASSIDLETSYSKTGRIQVKMAGIGKKPYALFTKDG